MNASYFQALEKCAECNGHLHSLRVIVTCPRGLVDYVVQCERCEQRTIPAVGLEHAGLWWNREQRRIVAEKCEARFGVGEVT